MKICVAYQSEEMDLNHEGEFEIYHEKPEKVDEKFDKINEIEVSFVDDLITVVLRGNDDEDHGVLVTNASFETVKSVIFTVKEIANWNVDMIFDILEKIEGCKVYDENIYYYYV